MPHDTGAGRHEHEWQDTGFATVEDCGVKGCKATRSDGTVFENHRQLALVDAALEAILVADTLDQAHGIAHAALNREEYHGHEC